MAKMKMLTGVVEVGLFCHMAKAAYFGNEVRPTLFLTLLLLKISSANQDGSVTAKWNDGRIEQVAASQ
jgi:ribose 5-phosphate isomerase A